MNGPSGWPDVDVEVVTADASRCSVEVQTVSGRAGAAEFRCRLDFVEVWSREHCCGVLDRDVLREWLARPGRPLVADEVALSHDRMVDRLGRVAISLPDVRAWTLSPLELANLRDRV
jgi:hypothetical protein